MSLEAAIISFNMKAARERPIKGRYFGNAPEWTPDGAATLTVGNRQSVNSAAYGYNVV